MEVISSLADTISEILQWANNVPPAYRLSKEEIDDFKNALEGIDDKIQKAKQQISYSNTDLQWLRKVKAIVNDLMDDLPKKQETTASRLLAKARNSLKSSSLQNKIKNATDNLSRLAKDKDAPSFAAQQPPFHMTFDGRSTDKKNIVELLLLNENSGSVPVVTIKGIAGVGKTELARLVCNDEQVKSPFDIHWVAATEFRDVDSIASRVNNSAATKEGKRFLLVLDDLRIELDDKCLADLQQILTKDSAILITARSYLVTKKITAKFFKPYELKGLGENDSWTLFQKFCKQASNIERDMVKNCKGVPRKIITKAACKEKSLEMLKFFFYPQLPADEKRCFAYCSLFPKDHLIDREMLVQLWIAEGFLDQKDGGECFTHDFIDLVFHAPEEETSYRMNHLMHELAGIVAHDENIIVDREGNKVHDEMVRASLDVSWCGIIPDSLFQKAKKLRTILLVTTAKTNKSRLPHEVKMSALTCDKIFNNFKNMCVLDLHDLGIMVVPSSIGEVKQLTYLDLSNNNIEKLPASITNLSNLMTLKLSQCHMLKDLPKDLEKMNSLRHLDLEGCLDLTHMPPGFGKLTCLQTLSLFVAASKNNNTMGGLTELVNLNNLKGHLEILHLEHFKSSASDAAYLKNKKQLQRLTLRWNHNEEEMQEKKEKHKSEKEEMQKQKSLESLEPPSNLEVLLVVGYNGKVFSNWLSSLHCLVKFSLIDCTRCQFLPPIDQLRNLKFLELLRLDSLEFIAKDSDEDNNTSTSNSEFFPSLREVTISDCPKLRSWWQNEKKWENNRPMFSCILKLEIQCCPELAFMPLYPNLDQELVLVDSNVRSMRDTMHANEISQSQSESKPPPPFSKLKSMFIERIQESPPESWLKNFTSLEKLHIRECFHLTSLPQGLGYLSSLQHLTIESCRKLSLNDQSGSTEWKGLKNLQTLTLREIPMLKSLPSGVGDVTSLQNLVLHECSGLTSLPESIGNLTSLGKLEISECKKLGCLPKGLRKLQSLHTLTITDCPLLLPRCQPETGDDWPQIANIRNKIVKQTSKNFYYWNAKDI